MDRWSETDINWLRLYYPVMGAAYCADYLRRTKSAIMQKAFAMNLISGVGRRTSKNRRIIQRLSGTRVMADCCRHGLVIHYDWSGKSLRCSLCAQESTRKSNRKSERAKITKNRLAKKYRRNSVTNYSDRLRNRLNHCFRNKTMSKRHGCFRHLPYSPRQLCDHLDFIRKFQNNQCPLCGGCYDDVGFTIDHVIPLATAHTEKEIVELFGLSNLSLLCGSCNSRKGVHYELADVF